MASLDRLATRQRILEQNGGYGAITTTANSTTINVATNADKKNGIHKVDGITNGSSSITHSVRINQIHINHKVHGWRKSISTKKKIIIKKKEMQNYRLTQWPYVWLISIPLIWSTVFLSFILIHFFFLCVCIFFDFVFFWKIQCNGIWVFQLVIQY